MNRRRFLFGSMALAVVAGCDSNQGPSVAPAPKNLPPPPSNPQSVGPPQGRTSRVTTGAPPTKLRSD